MNLSAFRAAVRTRGGWPTGDALYTDAVLTQLVNAAVAYIGTEHDWAWLEKQVTVNTAAGTNTYTPAADWQRTISVRHPDGYQLKRVPIDELDLLTDASGPPKVYANPGVSLVVAPTPSAIIALSHRYIASEPDLVADADLPLLPARFHQAVVEYAAYLAFRREGNAAEAGAALAAYTTWQEQMMKVASRYSTSQGGGETAKE